MAKLKNMAIIICSSQQQGQVPSDLSGECFRTVKTQNQADTDSIMF